MDYGDPAKNYSVEEKRHMQDNSFREEQEEQNNYQENQKSKEKDLKLHRSEKEERKGLRGWEN